MNYKLFDKWTEESAYFLGTVAVIGEVDGATLTVKSHDADFDWLQRVAGIIGLKKISINKSFSISHKQLTQPLWDMKNKHGSVVEAVPEELFHHFARGILDAGGDASDKAVLFTGKLGTLRKVRDRLKDLVGLTDTSIIDSEPDKPPTLKYIGSDINKIGKFLYKGVDELCLQSRKQGFPKEEETIDEPCESHRPRSQRPGCTGESSEVLRPRTHKGPSYDPMVW